MSDRQRTRVHTQHNKVTGRPAKKQKTKFHCQVQICVYVYELCKHFYEYIDIIMLQKNDKFVACVV